MLVWLMVELVVEELGGGIVAGYPGFSESSGKISHIVSHSRSMSLISFRKLAFLIVALCQKDIPYA